MGDLVFVIVVGAVAASLGVAVGIFLLAPRITRAIDRDEKDEERRDRPN